LSAPTPERPCYDCLHAITDRAPGLLDCYGVGPDTAAALLIAAGENPDRLTSHAAFVALCGVSPIEASSGKTIRHRLNRGGDRRANSALYTVVFTRLGRDPRTRNYANRRTTEGKSAIETIRCLKRYVARELFPIIATALAPGETPPAGRFDAVFLLEIDQQTMRTHIGDPRQGNDFGKAGDSLAVALASHTPIVAAWRRYGAMTIDATRAVDTVAEELLIAAGLAVLRRTRHDT
jgi:hypothetical protein